MPRGQRSETRPESRDAGGRAKRVPLGTPELKMEVSSKDPNYVYRWVNDEGNRIARAMQGGYEMVEDSGVEVGSGVNRNTDMGGKVSQYVGTQKDGAPLRAHLMRIKKEWYEEDQDAKAKKIDEKERHIKGGGIEQNEHLEQSHTYVPTEGIKIRTEAT